MAPQISSQDLMMAQTLSRIKKQSKQVDKLNKVLGLLPGQFKDLDKRQSRQFKQVKQLQKQVVHVKTSGAKTKRNASKKRKQ
jgi:hypothetical protein